MKSNFEMPDLVGKTAVITGANSGLGMETARVFGRLGARVVLACRNPEKGKGALTELVVENPDGQFELMMLDLSSLDSVHTFASTFQEKFDHLDILCNNAGVMMLPEFQKTADGFEMQFGTNHLGHFALTGLLFPLLKKTAGARIVTVSSNAHRWGKFELDNLNSEKKYNRNSAYGISKISNLYFTYELQRRCDASNLKIVAAAAHPGWTATNLQRHTPLFNLGNKLGLAQSTEMGALPQIRAALDPNVGGGEYYGPKGWGEWRGQPKQVNSNSKSHSIENAQRLWEISEKLTGVNYPFVDE